jgi:rSAM/selenodomain-associated transferase 2
MKLTVIVPVLDEIDHLPAALAALRRQSCVHEVVVVDGGSTDGTQEWLQKQDPVRVVQSPAGRGAQLNAGARAATGDTLIFLHADCLLPGDAGDLLRDALTQPRVAGGCFCVRFAQGRPRSLGLVAAGINLRTRLTRSATGDQGIFVRREVFEKIGGFRDWPLFEDADFARRMKSEGRFIVLPSPITVSARRHLKYGIFRTVFFIYALRMGFWAGIPPVKLANWYRHMGSGIGPPLESPKVQRVA